MLCAVYVFCDARCVCRDFSIFVNCVFLLCVLCVVLSVLCYVLFVVCYVCVFRVLHICRYCYLSCVSYCVLHMIHNVLCVMSCL